MLRRMLDSWWTVVLRGVLALLIGVATLIWPDLTLAVLIILFGVYALIDGLLSWVELLARRPNPRPRWVRFLSGLLGVVAGLIALFWPGITSLALLWLIATWAILRGILEITVAVTLRRHLQNTWLLILAGVLSVILGVIYFIFPGAGILSLVWMLGAYLILVGIVLLARGFTLRSVRRRLDSA